MEGVEGSEGGGCVCLCVCMHVCVEGGERRGRMLDLLTTKQET